MLIGLVGLIFVGKKWFKNYNLKEHRISSSFFNRKDYPIYFDIFKNYTGSIKRKYFIIETVKLLGDKNLPDLFNTTSLLI